MACVAGNDWVYDLLGGRVVVGATPLPEPASSRRSPSDLERAAERLALELEAEGTPASALYAAFVRPGRVDIPALAERLSSSPACADTERCPVSSGGAAPVARCAIVPRVGK